MLFKVFTHYIWLRLVYLWALHPIVGVLAKVGIHLIKFAHLYCRHFGSGPRYASASVECVKVNRSGDTTYCRRLTLLAVNNVF